jgi:hypothetical protein
MIMAPPPNPELAALVMRAREASDDARASRERLELLAGDPLETTVETMIEDLRA